MELNALEIGKKVRKLRNSRGLTQHDLANKSNISRSYLSDVEGGRYNPSIETLKDIANALGVQLIELLGDAEHNKQGIKIPVLGRVVAGIPLEAITDIIDYEEISAEMAAKGEYFALKVRGESMAPRIKDGDIVIIRKQPDINSGDLAIVIINGYDATLKKVIKQEGGILLSASNPEVYPPKFYTDEDIVKLPVEVLGKVVELRAKF